LRAKNARENVGEIDPSTIKAIFSKIWRHPFEKSFVTVGIIEMFLLPYFFMPGIVNNIPDNCCSFLQ